MIPESEVDVYETYDDYSGRGYYWRDGNKWRASSQGVTFDLDDYHRRKITRPLVYADKEPVLTLFADEEVEEQSRGSERILDLLRRYEMMEVDRTVFSEGWFHSDSAEDVAQDLRVRGYLTEVVGGKLLVFWGDPEEWTRFVEEQG